MIVAGVLRTLVINSPTGQHICEGIAGETCTLKLAGLENTVTTGGNGSIIKSADVKHGYFECTVVNNKSADVPTLEFLQGLNDGLTAFTFVATTTDGVQYGGKNSAIDGELNADSKDAKISVKFCCEGLTRL